MSTEIVSGPLGEIRAASTASGGTALTTTATFIQLVANTRHLFLTPRNFATAVVARFALNPYLVVLKTTDGLATKPTDYSSAAQDADTATSIDVSELSTVANGDFLLVGSHLPIRGVYIDVDGTNTAGTATSVVAYWNGVVWTNYSITDGTNSTRTFEQDGLVSWTVAAAWRTAKLKELYPAITYTADYLDMPLYWLRWGVSAALTDTSVTFDSFVAANRSTAYAELAALQTFEQAIQRGMGGIGCVEALVDAGTGNLIVNAATRSGGHF